MKTTLLIALAVGLFALPVFAQTDDAQQELDLCAARGLETIATMLEDAADMLRDDADGADTEQQLLIAATAVASYRAQCLHDLRFTSEEYGLKTVTDPILFPTGVYRLIIESTGSAEVQLTALDGRCGDTFTYTESSGGRNETVSVMENCLAVLDFDADADYTVTYEPILTAPGED